MYWVGRSCRSCVYVCVCVCIYVALVVCPVSYLFGVLPCLSAFHIDAIRQIHAAMENHYSLRYSIGGSLDLPSVVHVKV